MITRGQTCSRFAICNLQFAICNSLLCLLLFSAPAAACNVPVFRYALERWPADPYEVVVFHRGPLNADDRAALGIFEKHTSGDGTPANVHVEMVDLSQQPEEEVRKFFEAPGKPELPWMVVRYPRATRIEATIWASRLSSAAVKSLVDSPVRREMAKRIIGGETAVWLLLESGDQKKDDAAAGLMQQRLEKLKTLLKLPELTDSPADKLTPEGPPLRIAFSLIRLARSNPDEQMLIRMLLHSEEDLATTKGEPMAFPIFGRGRALWALVGKGIVEDNIDEACAFLVGPCSCQVKRQNPGTDLLMTASWPDPASLRGLADFLPSSEGPVVETLAVPPRPEEVDPTTPEAVGKASRFPNGPVLTAAPDRERKPDPAPPADSRLVLLRNIGLAVLAGFAVLAVGALVMKGRTARSDRPG